MYQIYLCVRDQHDLRLIALAATICILTSFSAIALVRLALNAQQKLRGRWLSVAGATAGFGVWATHFVAMLGYDPGIAIGYDLTLTLLSLVTVVVMTTLGFRFAAARRDAMGFAIGGTTVGLGIAAMHYMGMAAVEIPGTLHWSAPYVAASIVLAVVPAIAALRFTIGSLGYRASARAVVSFTVAVVLLHFTGMAAITVIPGRIEVEPSQLLSPIALGTMIAVVATTLLAMAVLAAIMGLRTQGAIAASEREFGILVQGISDCALYMLDRNGHVTNWNAGAARLKGYTAAEALGLPLAHFHTPEDRKAGTPDLALKTARDDGKFITEGWRVRKDGSRFWAHVTLERVLDDAGALRGYAKITRDISRFKEDQDRLTTLSANLDAALAHMHQGLCLYGPDGHLILANRRFRELYKIPEDAIVAGLGFEEIVRLSLDSINGQPVSDERFAVAMYKARDCLAHPDGGSTTIQYDNDLYIFIAHRPLPDGGWVSTYEDVSEHRRSQAQIAHMALHDDLTGLPNRSHFNERLDHDLDRAASANQKIAVVAIDLDRFKEVNDTWGHAAGDRLLRGLGHRLLETAGDREIVARFGGDEFAAYLPYREQGELSDFITRIEGCLTEPVQWDDVSITPSASIGIALYPGDGTTREQVLNNADLAMYRAKATVGRHVCFYEQGMDEKARERRQMANDLREAAARGELSVAYQVQRSLASYDIIGYEALLRWNHPRYGNVSPDVFIPIAEECGEILRIGEWVLRAACTEAASWQQPWKIAVNLSPIQLMHVDLVDIVTRALLDTGLSPKRLELEITESAIIGDKLRALHILRAIKALGVTVAIDDFGTGYSSLDTLNSFPFDKIKIDRSFLMESDTSPQARAIIRAVLSLGRSLEVPVLAEGIESEEQLRLLQAEGCDEAQGYLFGKPQMAAEIDHGDAKKPGRKPKKAA